VDEPVTITIGCPPVALKSPKTGEAPRLPRGWHALCRVEYGFDRSGSPRSEGSAAVEMFTLTDKKDKGDEEAAMRHECPLLEVQPTPGRRFSADPKSFVSLEFKVSPTEGVIEVAPVVSGPAQHAWPIASLRDMVETNDKKHDDAETRRALTIRKRIKDWCKPEVDQFGRPEEDEVKELIRGNCAKWAQRYQVPTGPHLEEFLSTEYKLTREKWDNRLREIRAHAAAIPRPNPDSGSGGSSPASGPTRAEYQAKLKQLDAQWDQEFRTRVSAWAEAYIEAVSAASDKERLYRPPLCEPATITVEKVWTTAVDEAGKEYEVPLSTLAESSPSEPRPRSPDARSEPSPEKPSSKKIRID
jgi:hypothetical protein